LLIASVIPVFVAALALTAFLNWFWMVRPAFVFTLGIGRAMTDGVVVRARIFHSCYVASEVLVLLGSLDCNSHTSSCSSSSPKQKPAEVVRVVFRT
jgi:hypothetical protein